MEKNIVKAKTIYGKAWTIGYAYPKKSGERTDWYLYEEISHHWNGSIEPPNGVRVIIPETISRYTGYKIGDKMLFEGDIVSYNSPQESSIDSFVGFVEFNSYGSCFGVSHSGLFFPFASLDDTENIDYFLDRCEIVGNIHDGMYSNTILEEIAKLQKTENE